MNELITAIRRYLGDRDPGQSGGDIADVWAAIERAEAATVITLTLNDTPENREKAEMLNLLEVAFDDPQNIDGAALDGFVDSLQWGSTIRVTFESSAP